MGIPYTPLVKKMIDDAVADGRIDPASVVEVNRAFLGEETRGKATPGKAARPKESIRTDVPLRPVLGFDVGLQLKSEANTGGTLPAKLGRKRQVKEAFAAAVGLLGPCPYALRPPLTVDITRFGPRLLDSDNLASSAKAVRDLVAAWIGIDDGPTGGATWRYHQQAVKTGYCVRILITGAAANNG